MVQKLVKYGSSVAVVLPAEILKALGLAPGSLVKVDRSDSGVVIQPVDVVPVINSQDKQFTEALYKRRKQVFKKLAES